MSGLFSPPPPYTAMTCIQRGDRFRSSANGWCGAIGTVQETEKDYKGLTLRVKLLRDDGQAACWFFTSELRRVRD